MAILLSQADFKKVIKRKNPCIICIENKLDIEDTKIHKLIDNICKEFPLVLCYKIDIYNYNKYHESKSIYGPNNVIRFEIEKITSMVDGKNYLEINKLFWQVYADSCIYNIEAYMKILYREKRLPKNYFLPYTRLEYIDHLGESENGIISQYLESKNIYYIKPRFSDNKNTASRLIKRKIVKSCDNSLFSDKNLHNNLPLEEVSLSRKNNESEIEKGCVSFHQYFKKRKRNYSFEIPILKPSITQDSFFKSQSAKNNQYEYKFTNPKFSKRHKNNSGDSLGFLKIPNKK